ncbi:MAG: hypothetical protein Q4C13_09195, partial [Clostridia bacterium]|nr:hypothetical protein [Clostridia bacterium]
RHLKDGHSVCLYPEGNRSWDGVTRPITPATGKMAKISGAKLVTYRSEGVYFSNPRWSGGSIRRGRTRGGVAGVYTPEYLSSLTAAQVQEIIERDLYENAYERQRAQPVKFRGRRLAEHLETLLFICPHCRAQDKLRSEGDYFICDGCGTRLRYTPEGFFVGENLVFDSVLDWHIWQEGRIRELCLSAGEAPIFHDRGMELYSVAFTEDAEFITSGSLRLYRDRLELPGGRSIALSELSGMALMGPQELYFSAGGKSFIIKGRGLRCLSRYLSACKLFDSSVQYGI